MLFPESIHKTSSEMQIKFSYSKSFLVLEGHNRVVVAKKQGLCSSIFME